MQENQHFQQGARRSFGTNSGADRHNVPALDRKAGDT